MGSAHPETISGGEGVTLPFPLFFFSLSILFKAWPQVRLYLGMSLHSVVQIEVKGENILCDIFSFQNVTNELLNNDCVRMRS